MKLYQGLLLVGCLSFSLGVWADENPAQLDTSVPAMEGVGVESSGVKSNEPVKSETGVDKKTDASNVDQANSVR